MTKQDIFDILDKNAASEHKTMKIVLGVGITLAIAAIVIYAVMDDPGYLGIVVASFGVLLTSGSTISLTKKTAEKKNNMIKDVLNNRPGDLVWAYTLAMKGNMSTVKNVILKFRDGTQFEIEEDSIPGSDCNSLVAALTVINPNMQLGYSEETEARYRQKQL